MCARATGRWRRSMNRPCHRRDRARQAFIEAMNNWDEAAADAAVAGLARTADAREVFEVFCRYGARDFRDIGHKAIYVANSWRTLQHIGWQHAEPVLRSLAYALLYRDGDNPARQDAPAGPPLAAQPGTGHKNTQPIAAGKTQRRSHGRNAGDSAQRIQRGELATRWSNCSIAGSLLNPSGMPCFRAPENC